MNTIQYTPTSKTLIQVVRTLMESSGIVLENYNFVTVDNNLEIYLYVDEPKYIDEEWLALNFSYEYVGHVSANMHFEASKCIWRIVPDGPKV